VCDIRKMNGQSHENRKNVFFSLASFVLLLVLFSTLVLAAPPSLVGVKAVSPNILYIGDSSTITLTVSGVGDVYTTTKPLDVILLIDNSCSISSTELATERTAAKTLVSLLSSGLNQIGVTSFNEHPTVRIGLTNSYSSVNTAINGITTRSECTNIGDAIKSAYESFDYTSGSKKVIILLSDGQANWPAGNYVQYALDQASIAREKGVIIYTIGMGNNINQNLLKYIADDKVTGSYHYYDNDSSLGQNFNVIFNNINQQSSNLAGTNVIVTDVLQVGVVPVSMPPQCSYSVSTRTVTCNAGSLNIGDTKTFSFNVIVYNSTINHLNMAQYVSYTNYLGASVNFDLNNPLVTILTRLPVCGDSVAPVVVINTPVSGVYSTGLMSVSIGASDANLNNVWYSLNGVNTSYNVPVAVNLSNGNYRLYAYANDSCGNLGSTYVDFVVNRTVVDICAGNIPPAVIINSPTNKIYSDLVNVSINATDTNLVQIWYNLNGTNVNYNSSVNVNLSNGNYRLYAYANDSCGSVSSAYADFVVNYTSQNNQTNHTDPTDDTSTTCNGCGRTHAPIDDFNVLGGGNSISTGDGEEVISLNYVNSSNVTSGLNSPISVGDARLIFNMLLVIAIVLLLFMIVLIGRRR